MNRFNARCGVPVAVMGAAAATMVMMVGIAMTGCAAPESIRELSRAQRGAIKELGLAWGAEHALVRAELEVLVGQRMVLVRGRVHRELLETGCITVEGDADGAVLGELIGDAASDIGLVREVRLGRMSEAEAAAWLDDYAIAMRLGEAGDGDGVRERVLGRLAEVEGMARAWEELRVMLDARAERVMKLAQEAGGASDDLAAAIESRIAWREIGSDVGTEALGPVIDGVFEDEARRKAARELLERLLGVKEEEV